MMGRLVADSPVFDDQVRPKRIRLLDLDGIEVMERAACIEHWCKIHGAPPPKFTSIEFMKKAASYEAQVKAHGGLSTQVRRALKGALKVAYNRDTEDEQGKAAIPLLNLLGKSRWVELNAGEGHAGTTSNMPSLRTARVPRQVSKATMSAVMTENPKPKPKLKPKPSVLSLRAGTHLVREWNGRTYQVEALDKGFKLDGKIYRSLSAIAKKITGAHWSGPRFFGLDS